MSQGQEPPQEWDVQTEAGDGICGIYPRYGRRIVGGITRIQAEAIAAAHNATLKQVRMESWPRHNQP